MQYQKISDNTKLENGVLIVPKTVFYDLSKISFTQMRKFFREEHLAHWKEILDSPKSSPSEKEKMQRNLQAVIESKNKGVPYCQDTGTDSVYVFCGDCVVLVGEESLESKIGEGAIWARQNNPYRNSVFVPDEKNLEKNSGDNSPAEIHFFHNKKKDEIRGIFSNKGGGSGSKLWNFSMPPSLYQDEKKLIEFLIKKILEIGHSACPPYHLRIVLGGLSQLHNSELLTRSTIDDFSFLSDKIIRDKQKEHTIVRTFGDSDIGAQGKGKFFFMPDGVSVVRAPRHAAHFFVGIGVACSAHRVQEFKINKDGVFLEKLCENPEKFLEKNNQFKKLKDDKKKLEINLSENREKTLEKLRKIKAGEEFLISGKILGARDKAHSKWLADFEKTKKMPDYLREILAVFYVGPSDTPKGDIIGSFGPTTATRMDCFAPFLFANELLPLSIAKGTRSKEFAKNCKKYQGMFAAIQGGPASILRKYVKSVEVLDFEEFGMEAVRLYEISKMPVQMITDSRGVDFYAELEKSLRIV